MTVPEWFALLEQRAPALRTAGVTEIALEGVTVRFAPAAPVTLAPVTAASGATAAAELDDPLATIPGYTLEPEH